MSSELDQIMHQAKSQARSERFKSIFVKHKKLIKAIAIAVGLALIIFLAFSFVQNIRENKFSEMLHQSLLDQQLGDFEKAKKGLKEIYETSSAPSGVRAVASLRYAAFLLQEGKVAESLKVYQDINECTFCSPYLKDLAGLLTVKIWLSDESEMAKEDLSGRIEKIEKASKPLKQYVAEQRAIFEMKKNNLEKSYKIFESIKKASDASVAIKERAENGMRILVSKGYEPKSEIKSGKKDDDSTREKADADKN